MEFSIAIILSENAKREFCARILISHDFLAVILLTSWEINASNWGNLVGIFWKISKIFGVLVGKSKWGMRTKPASPAGDMVKTLAHGSYQKAT